VNNVKRRSQLVAGAIALTLLAAACGGDDSTTEDTAAPGETTAPGEPSGDLSGEIAIDGSSTVAPLMKLTAEDFQDANGGVTVTVGTSGTGGGFEKFCAGETDISNASRPIKDEEIAACEESGIEYTELHVGERTRLLRYGQRIDEFRIVAE
jgi:phosphate transport system substrate-binding protein